ncbi:MAG: hypothetical protein M3522_09720 [Actinomycetota bacterium]|nr:hypothetical protein [Actinomycetota bacterium]
MSGLADFWFAGRLRELIREADHERLARELHHAQKTPAGGPATSREDASAGRCPCVRRGTPRDAPRIARLLELNGMPRWVAFEERFVIAEEGVALTAAIRFRQERGRLHLGLLVADPRAEEHPLAVALYVGARTIARRSGLHEVRAWTHRHQRHLREAGYRRRGGAWRISP